MAPEKVYTKKNHEDIESKYRQFQFARQRVLG